MEWWKEARNPLTRRATAVAFEVLALPLPWAMPDKVVVELARREEIFNLTAKQFRDDTYMVRSQVIYTR